MFKALVRGGLVVLLALYALPQAAARERTDVDCRLEDLQRQLDEMRRKHDEETKALRDEIERLKGGDAAKAAEDSELARLLALADEEALAEGVEEGRDTGETSFIARGLGLQALNPEISITGDFIAKFVDPEEKRSFSDLFVRGIGIHIESYLDPYTKLKAAIEVAPEGAELGEAYFTRFGVLPNVSLTVGKFRQQFGVVNRWHKHGLDELDFPLALRGIFGEGGLNQTGLSARWSMPGMLGASPSLVVEITEAGNGRVFGENSRHLPCVLVRHTRFRDLTKDTYLDLGLTGLVGWNDTWTVEGVEVRDRRTATVLGADVTIRWEPTERMRYASVEWRSEVYWLSKAILASDGSGRDEIRAWGACAGAQVQLDRTLFTGARFDWFEPDGKRGVEGLEPLVYDARDPRRWQIGPYLTWWQSPFVKAHLEVIWADGRDTGPADLTVALQIVVAAGPHKHERY
jgi:hypothetical protein